MCASHQQKSSPERAGARGAEPPAPDPGCRAARHHSASAYTNAGCRCTDAKELARLYRKRLRHGLPTGRGLLEATGTRRRLQALVALGWSQNQLAATLGASPSVVSQLVLGATYRHVEYATAANVAALYDELSMTPGPCARARDRAARLGYVPPLAWAEGTIDDPRATPVATPDRHTARQVDPVAVARLHAGQRPTGVTRAERNTAITTMTRAGASAHAIARRIGVSSRSVTRQRSAAATDTPPPGCGVRQTMPASAATR
jgi:DNA-binding transcriptional regulator YdaS (Cro superfamily)